MKLEPNIITQVLIRAFVSLLDYDIIKLYDSIGLNLIFYFSKTLVCENSRSRKINVCIFTFSSTSINHFSSYVLRDDVHLYN